MSDAFTVMWTKPRCDVLRKAGDEGKPLTVLFGGCHQSAPSLRRAGIVPGDTVFPVLVHGGALHLISEAVAKGLIGLNDYLTEHLCLNPLDIEGVPEYRLEEVLKQRLGPLGHRMPYGCGIEVLLLERATPIRFDVVVPPQQLETVAFCPRKGPPMGLKGLRDGRLTSALSFQGNIRRLSPETAKMFSATIAGK